MLSGLDGFRFRVSVLVRAIAGRLMVFAPLVFTAGFAIPDLRFGAVIPQGPLRLVIRGRGNYHVHRLGRKSLEHRKRMAAHNLIYR